MARSPRILACLALIVGAFGLPQSAKASLIGDTVDCSFTPTTLWACAPPSAVVIDPGAEFVVASTAFPTFFNFSIDIAAATILFTLNLLQIDLVGGELLTLSSLDSSAGPIVGFNFDFSTATGFDAADVSTGPNSTSWNLNGTIWESGDQAQITLLFAGQAVPEPSTLLLIAAASLGLGFRRRRKEI